MSRLIDADAIPYTMLYKEDWLKGTGVEKPGVWKDTIDAMPTIQPERKKGEWIPQDHNKTNGMASTLVYYYPKCSVCGHCDNYTNFCPNCGSDMRGE